MYAIVVVGDDHSVIAIRDRLGLKPLYVARRGDDLAFASELKAFTGSGWETIEVIPAGHYWENGELNRYYSLPEPVLGGSADECEVSSWCEQIYEVMDRSVRKRMMSDVPLGAFLSGGLDSSIIAYLAAKYDRSLQTFALGFEGSADLVAARTMAEHLGTDHSEILVAESAPVEILEEVIYHLETWDKDLVRSAIPNYLVAEFAAKRVKVVLTGEGADELFAGYSYHCDYAHDLPTLQLELNRLLANLGECNLQRVDRMTMAHSLEARVPFLDPEMIQLAMSIPADLKLRRDDNGNLVEKWILRKAFEDHLPSEIVWRTKSQFDEGSGASERLARLAEERSSLARSDWPTSRIRDREEAWYFELARQRIPDWQPIADNAPTWIDQRLVPAR